MLILPQRTRNNAFNVFIWTSLFVGIGMQMCLYSIEWYARQNCPRAVVRIPNRSFFLYKFIFLQNGPLDYFVPRSFFCRDANDTLPINELSSVRRNQLDL